MADGDISVMPAGGAGAGAVTSVAGRTGDVVLTGADVGVGAFPALRLAAQTISGTATLVGGTAALVKADTTGGTFTITLPAAPTSGDVVIFEDSAGQWSTNNLTIDLNGKTLNGGSTNPVLSQVNGTFGIIYDGTGWHSIIHPPSDAAPVMDGVAAAGVGFSYARRDHVHPTDTSRAPVASPTFTGTPAAPTPTTGDRTTKIATMQAIGNELAVAIASASIPEADVAGLIADLAAKAPVASPTFTGIVTAPEYSASGLTGATAASRYVGATTSGPPTSGTFAVGDFILDQSGVVWICTAAGTPGTWRTSGSRPVRANAYLSAIAGKTTTIALSTTVNKLQAVPLPRDAWGRTAIAYGINQTIAPVTTGGKATAVTARVALATDAGGVPATSIISGSEGTIDLLTGAPTGGLTSGAVSSVIPAFAWVLFVIQPTGGDGTLSTYPTLDSYNTQVEGVASNGSPGTATVGGYSESGQTTTATMVGATNPAVSTPLQSPWRVQVKVS